MRELGTRVTPLTEEQVDELVSDYEAGHKVNDIAVKYGMSRGTLRRYLVRRGVPLRHQPISEALMPEAIALYEAGHTLVEVGARLSVDPGTLRDTLRRHGVEIRAASRRTFTVGTATES